MLKIIGTLHCAHVWNKTSELGCLFTASRNIFKGRDQLQEYRNNGIFDDDDEESPRFNKRGAYMDNSERRWESPSFRQRGRYNDFVENKYSNFRRNNRNEWNDRGDNNRSYNQNFMANNRRDFIGNQLQKVSYDSNSLSPIEKNFYVEHPRVAEKPEEEVERYRSTHNINVSGSNIPRPITEFDELSLPDNLRTSLRSLGYGKPTPIQAQGWPLALSGRDMVGVSQTGSGKTLVFMLPAVIHASNQQNIPHSNYHCNPQVLVMAPTRELVQQIHSSSDKFVLAGGLRSACAYGGASKNVQLQCLRGAEICIATPGRLIDYVASNLVSLANCTYLVLDEADRMLDMGFEPQIRQIVDQMRPDRQTLMWSATWPQSIRSLAEDFLTQYVKVTVGNDQLAANPNIQQNIYFVDEWEKKEKIVSLLKQIMERKDGKVLIFAQMKRNVDTLGYFLNSQNIPALCIHGDISQYRRDAAVRRFREQNNCVLIATDIAARGLDISNIENVINYDFPTCIEDYVHRIGRTARGDKSGMSHSFFTKDNANLAKDLIATLEETNQHVDPQLHTMMQWVRDAKRKSSLEKRGRYQERGRYAMSKM